MLGSLPVERSIRDMNWWTCELLTLADGVREGEPGGDLWEQDGFCDSHSRPRR